MKKIFALAFTAAVLVSCNKDGYKIAGDVKGFEDGTKVYINKQDENGFTKIDSTEIKGGTFEFKNEKTPDTDIYFIELGKTQEFAFPFILEKGDIKFTFDKAKPENAKVNGTKNNDLMTSYNEEANKINKEIMDFQQQNQAKFMEAQQKGDQATMKTLMDQITKMQEKYIDQNKKFIGTNKDSFVSLLLLMQLSMSDALKPEEIKKYYNDFDASVKDSKKGKEFAESLKKMEESLKESEAKQQKVAVGQKAPDFTAATPEGKQESLLKNLGKVTIIDFWASWCGPCRQENPNVVALYNKYKDQGLKIIGVSLDKEKEKWVKAIADDKLAWLQVSNLKFWEDPIAKDYAVESIPATFILDANGTIVAKDLRGAELEAKVAELLK
ncbi:AhpC/TSA family protein [Flavobacterium sp. xlx-214]|uniref:TlpA disulfide reductase family protein n=1 Tax=unclassified Flavobacterium TaxID=196869 RepID=UPI0013D5A032|nr:MULTISPECIES: TlpA disulfide reductase family protein [unclassified Flavobacterium]MBA5791387.1 AhpC/TSA family protein [Flavobacterium sp. xlx-221]QMI83461.1 AhpC/TSA family protein [Flavobacterium sp. xlx-214]